MLGDFTPEALKAVSDLLTFAEGKSVTIGSKKYEVKSDNGKVKLEPWPSVAGGKVPDVEGVGLNRKGTKTSGLNAKSRDAYVNTQQSNLAKQTTDAGKAAVQANINRARAGA